MIKVIQHHLAEPNARVLCVCDQDAEDGEDTDIPMDPGSPVKLVVDEDISAFPPREVKTKDKIIIFSAFPRNFGHITAVRVSFTPSATSHHIK